MSKININPLKSFFVGTEILIPTMREIKYKYLDEPVLFKLHNTNDILIIFNDKQFYMYKHDLDTFEIHENNSIPIQPKSRFIDITYCDITIPNKYNTYINIL